MNRNLLIDWVKGLMITIIVLHHYFLIPGFNQTYLPVDVFFCISGYFLMNSFVHKRTTAISYTVKRIQRIYPALLVSLVLSCLLLASRLDFSNFSSFLESIGKLSFILTLTNGLAPSLSFPIMDITWYLSVLIIAGFLVYSLLDYNEKLACTLLFPLSIIIGFSLIFSNDSSVQHSGMIYGLSFCLIRAFCDIAMGVLVFEIYSKYREALNKRSVIVNILSLLCFAFFLALMFSKKCLDVYMVFCLPVIMLGMVYDKSWAGRLLGHIKGGLFSRIGKYTLEILVIHQLVMIGLYKILSIAGVSLPIYVIILLDLLFVYIAGYLLHVLCEHILNNQHERL